MNVSESKIEFRFDDRYHVLKLDDTAFYCNLFNQLPGSKAVDFLAYDESRFLMIEVKNCVGNEADNRWRIAANNMKRETTAPNESVLERDSLDIEAAQKTAMSIAALFGAYTRPVPQSVSDECVPFAQALFDAKVLDGQFGCRTRSDLTIRQELQNHLKRKLKWLNGEVLVLDSQTLSTKGLNLTAVRIA
ncbi:MAG: DUF6661 family protein [Clostridia bacterium]